MFVFFFRLVFYIKYISELILTEFIQGEKKEAFSNVVQNS